jgi:glycerol-3-phosphate dehydrogenase
MEYDLLIIGGGVYGAFAAWDAVLRGLSVALIEKGDFAGGTSANSLKVVHGGLRYLQNADFARTRESAREQGCFLSIAPHLVHTLRFLIPTEGMWTRSRSAMAFAFGMYEMVKGKTGTPSGERKFFPHGKIVSRQECRVILRGAAVPGCSGGAVWHEGIVHNTERFVISILRSAASKGLQCANYTEAKRFLIKGRRILGIEALDRLTGDRFEIRARCTMNATGPWARHVNHHLMGRPPEGVPPLLKAINLIVGRPLFEGYAVGLPARPAGQGGFTNGKGRFYFFVPWRGTTMIGTYYAPYRGEPDAAAVEEKDIEEFLSGIRTVLPEDGIAMEDVSCLHFGLQPMEPAPDRHGESSPAQKPWICDHARSEGLEGLVSLQGVKYTTARVVAEQTVDLILSKLGGRRSPCRTETTPIFGGERANAGDPIAGMQDERVSNFPDSVRRHLTSNYGSEFSRILGYALERPELAKPVTGSKEVLRAELVHGIREEMAQSLGDLVFRRTDLGTTGHPGRDTLDECARIAAGELGWDGPRISREMETVERSYPNAVFLPIRMTGSVREPVV